MKVLILIIYPDSHCNVHEISLKWNAIRLVHRVVVIVKNRKTAKDASLCPFSLLSQRISEQGNFRKSTLAP